MHEWTNGKNVPHSILNILQRNLTPPYEGEETIDPEKIVDLTDKMDSGGEVGVGGSGRRMGDYAFCS